MFLSVSLTGFAAPAASPKPKASKAPQARAMPEWSLTETLRDLIRAAFDSDSRVPSSSIGIAVSAGMIALFGTVPDERAKRAAFELASSIPGAPPVNNRLRVGEDAA